MSLNVGRVLLSTITTTAAQATVDFDDLLDATYDTYSIEFSNVAPVTDVRFMIARVGTGSTYDAGASDYHETSVRNIGPTSTVPTGFSDSSSSGPFITQGTAMGTGTGELAHGNITIYRPSDVENTFFKWETSLFGETANIITIQGTGMRTSQANRPSFRLLLNSTGGFAADGVFKLYGIR